MRRTLITAVLGFCFLALPEGATAQTIIDTRNGPVDTKWASGSEVIGQTFIAPADNLMAAGSLWFGTNSAGYFTAILQEYFYGNDEYFVGPRLWESGPQVVFGRGPSRFDFDIGGVSLTPGRRYAFYAYSPLADITAWTSAATGTSAPGFAILGSSLDQVSAYGYDEAFVGTFVNVNATPEPTSLLLLATGVLGVGFGARRRRNA